VKCAGIRDLRVYCSDYKCSHTVEIKADQWPDHVGLYRYLERRGRTAPGQRQGLIADLHATGTDAGASCNRQIHDEATAEPIAG
jgi:hypothetical protein